MKKIFTTTLLAIAIIMSTMAVNVSYAHSEFDFERRSNNSYDVPDLAQYGGYFKYQQRKNGYIAFFYNGNPNLNAYMQAITSNYPFFYSDHYVHYTKRGKFVAETWFFTYKGSKSVPTFGVMRVADNNRHSYCHLAIKVTGRGSITVMVTDGLKYAGDTGIYSSGGGGDQFCSACTGSGRCNSCGGSGYYTMGGNRYPCASCATSGKCAYCGGTGKA
ncbi:MAG: hypothetical protein IJ563_07375 [Selenomonadaceae bacterium]|nr:hypothetical protein [Selenomonadaceae bacterium]